MLANFDTSRCALLSWGAQGNILSAQLRVRTQDAGECWITALVELLHTTLYLSESVSSVTGRLTDGL
eukprot:1181871-Prorocentrum_minimum.AAC.5